MKPRTADRKPLRLSPVTAVLLIGTGGCASLIGADFDPARLETKTRDASVERSSVEEASTCDPLVPPTRPADLAKATDEADFTVVVRTVDFGDSAPDGGVPGYFTTGYDLDGLCTKASGPSACVPQPWLGKGVHVDGPRGQDDAVALLMLNQTTTFGVTAIGSAQVNAGVSGGTDGPIGVIRVRGFGGLGEDDHVEVDWFAATTLRAPGDGGADAGVAPHFDTSDHWPIVSTAVEDPTITDPANAISKYRDANAFVVKNTLVAHFPHIEIPLSNVYFDLSNVSMTAEARRVQGTWRLENVAVAGATPVKSLLGVVPQIAFVEFGVSLCTDNNANYPKVKRFLCESADLPAAPGDPASSRCSATSAGMRIETAPASLGPIVTPPPLPNPCPPETDPHNDSCDVPAASE